MRPSAFQTQLLSARRALRKGGVGVFPTDTLYGVVGRALDPVAVRKIYALRKRNPKKPMIILIADMGDLKKFGVRLDTATRKILRKAWPGKASVVFPLAAGAQSKNPADKKFAHLHRGTRSLAFRLPRPKWLRAFLRKTGPLVAPSANHEGRPPALTIASAKKYFGNGAAFYVDKGRRASGPSTLVAVRNGKWVVLRAGARRMPVL